MAIRRKRGPAAKKATVRAGSRLEQAMRDSEARFRSLTHLSSDWFWEQDAEYRFTRLEGPLVAGGDQSLRQRLIGQRRWDSGLQIDTEGGWDAHRALLDARQPFHDLLMWRRMDDGRLRWVEVSGEPVFAPDGSFAGYRGVGRDVTARKRDEALLRLEHTAARGLADAEDSAKALQAVLKAVCETEQWDCGLYFQVDEAAGRLRCVEAWGRDGARDFVEGLAATQFERGAGLAGHVWAAGEPLWVPDVHADGRVSPAGRELATRIHAALVFPVIADGRVIGVLSFSSARILQPDARLQQTIGVIGSQVGQFLRRRRAEESLRESEARFRRTFELAGSGFAHIGLDRRFMRVNRRLCEILGYSERELMGLTGRDISHPEDLDVINQQRPRLYAGEVDTVRSDKRYLRKDGSVVWATLTLALERDLAGRPQYEIAVYDDITARKAAEDALRESEARFRSLTQMSSDFFWESDVGHRFTQLVYGPGYQAAQVGHDAIDAIRAKLESRVAFRDFEFARALPDGATRYFTVSGDPRFAADGAFLGYRNIATGDGGALPGAWLSDWPANTPGNYQNGGSWLLYDALALYAGARHEVAGARALFHARLRSETRRRPQLHEYLRTDDDLGGSDPRREGYGWNGFVANLIEALA